MKIYAHSIPEKNESFWEPLEDHLLAVADKASDLASVFGGANLARAMGALHDVGKTSEGFQKYIRDLGNSVDHSTAGAVIAACRYAAQPTGKVLGRLMAYGIAGHHAGLANGAVAGGGMSSLTERLQGKSPITLAAAHDLAPAEITLSAPVLSKGFGLEFSAPFLTRMLFSCLIDADRLETERFYTGKGRDPYPLTLRDLRERLDAHLSGFAADGAKPAHPVQSLRAEVLAAVRARARDEPGLFSLTVPTGGGKTLSSLAFALDHAIHHGLRRVIYVIPFTSIVEQTAEVFRKALGDDDAVLEHHSGFDFGTVEKGRTSTGEQDNEGPDGTTKLRMAAENWDRPIIVTTAVQFFESLFSNRPSACRKLHAIAGSVVILDEAQTLPLDYLRPCMASLQELARGYRTSVVLCTATQPAITRQAGFRDGLENVRELAPEPERLYRQLKRVTVERIRQPLGIADLGNQLLAEQQVLCITNNRRHARDLYRSLKGQDGARHLSTLMCGKHRQQKLADIRQDLKEGRPVRLASTSLVEAGVDFSFPAVYRAMAGLDSIAQAAGRCNRNGDQPEPGRVYIFSSPEDEGYRPPPELRRFAEVADTILRNHDDPLALDTLHAYFSQLYWQCGHEELDAAKVGESGVKGILQALDLYKSSQNYPFADIAQAFRIIKTPLVPVIVPYRPENAPDTVETLLDQLRFVDPGKTGGIARKLQSYLVQIPRSARAELLKSGAAEAIRPDKFGDQFITLINHDLYDAEVGLDWEDPTFRHSEGLVF